MFLILLDEVAAAIHTLDTLVNPPNSQRPIEAIVLLASLRAFPRPGVTSSDATQERQKARELYDQVLKTIEGISTDEYTQNKALVGFGDDDVHYQGGEFVDGGCVEVGCWGDGDQVIGIVSWGDGIWTVTPV